MLTNIYFYPNKNNAADDPSKLCCKSVKKKIRIKMNVGIMKTQSRILLKIMFPTAYDKRANSVLNVLTLAWINLSWPREPASFVELLIRINFCYDMMIKEK